MAKRIEADLKSMGFTDEQIATALVDGKPLAEFHEKPKRSARFGKFRSATEAAYALELNADIQAGRIIDWGYERITFRLTDGDKDTRAIKYTPDFDVWLPDGRLRIVEIKGKKAAGGRRDAAGINNYKMAKDKYPHIDWMMISRIAAGWKQIM